MPASFPSSIATFTTKQDYVDTVFAGHVNALQDEVVAIETKLGTGFLTSTTVTYDSVSTSWTTLSARLNNLESGLKVAAPIHPFLLGGM